MPRCFLLLSLLLLTPARALEPGAWESFFSVTNANAWTLFKYEDFEFGPPDWVNEVDPFIKGTMTDEGVWIYADDRVADGAFTGDYSAASVESIAMDVYLPEPLKVSFVDVVIRSNVGDVEREYYTVDFEGMAFFEEKEYPEQAWFPMELWLDEAWWYETGDPDNPWKNQVPSATELSNIVEIGIRFFPTDVNTTPIEVGIDNVVLYHPVVAAELEIRAEANMVNLSFQPRPAHVYFLKTFNVTTGEWEDVTGQTDIMGPDPFLFETPAVGVGVFRCEADPYYTEVETE